MDLNTYTNNVTQTLKNIAHDNAVRLGNNDEGFKLEITKDDIKKATGKQRIGKPIQNKVVNTFNNSSFQAKEKNGVIEIQVNPILSKKDKFTLNELLERENAIKEINLRENIYYSNN